MSSLEHLLSPDPNHLYSDDELDAIEELDPEMALRIARIQHIASQAKQNTTHDGAIDESEIVAAVEEARQILSRDGGDIELIAIDGPTVKVRMKGACAGCPNSAFDLKNIVEKLIKMRSPGVETVQNVF